LPRKTGLTPAKKREAILRLLRREETGAKIARRYGISEQTLYRYRDAFLEHGLSGLRTGGAGNGEAARIKELERALAERDQVIGELTIANRILKKTAES